MEFAIDTIYHWVSQDNDDEMYFYTDDGLGFVYFDSLSEAREQTGIESAIVSTDTLPE